MATLLPHVTFNATGVTVLNRLLGENAQATNRALAERVTGHRLTLSRYAATGATTSRIPLGSVSPQGSAPWAVLLVRVCETQDPAKDLSVTTRLNFSRDDAQKTLYVYEPQGLTALTLYDMDFLVLE